MEKNSPLRGLTWRVGVLSQYESSWMACHRFLHLNAMTGQELYKLMTSRVGKQRSISGKNFERYIWKSKEFIGPFSEHAQARSINNIFGAVADDLFSGVLSFRYCSECLKNFFHSPIFYFPCVTHCPVHLLPLKNACKGGMHLIGSIHILPERFKITLGCQVCGESFSEPPYTRLVAGEGQVISETLDSVEQWLQSLKYWKFDGIHVHRGGNEYLKSIVFEAVCETLSILSKPPEHASWMSLRRSTIAVENSKYLFNLNNHAKTREFFPLNEDIESVCNVVKSIGRHLSKVLRRCCGHKCNVCLDWSVLGNSNSLWMDGKFCPYCSALIQWRACAGKILAIRSWVRESGRPLLDCNQIFRVRYSIDMNVFAEVALSNFTWFAVSLARRLRAIQNSDDGMYFAHEQHHVQRMKEMDEYELPISHHDFQFKGIRFEGLGGEIRYFRFSLYFAINELAKCKKGVSPCLGGRSRNDDIWYIDSSKNNINNLFFRLWPYI